MKAANLRNYLGKMIDHTTEVEILIDGKTFIPSKVTVEGNVRVIHVESEATTTDGGVMESDGSIADPILEVKETPVDMDVKDFEAVEHVVTAEEAEANNNEVLEGEKIEIPVEAIVENEPTQAPVEEAPKTKGKGTTKTSKDA